MAKASLEYHRKYYNARVARLIRLLGGKCAVCGGTENLEFDHVDPADKAFAITQRVKWSDETVLPELAKCQLLCQAHHKVKTIAAVSVEHGGGLSGRKNCKCDPCKARKAEYMREWKRRRASVR